MLPRPPGTDLKAACALLTAGTLRGTGFLVSASRLLTCNHVVRNAGDGPIKVDFSHGQYEATVDLVDPHNDCALLLLKQPVPMNDAQPLAIAAASVQKGSTWEGYGFPAATGQAGLLIDGRVQDPAGQDQALRPAVVLQSANVTAGSWLSGFSGSPVVVEGKVVGQMRKIIADESGGAQMAVIYACPADILADLAGRRLGDGAWQAPNPYRGLAAFQPEDAPFFFGRQELTKKLLQRFQTLFDTPGQRRLLAVLGPSGSGKSSAVLAGLLPMLRAQPLPGPMPARIVLLKPGGRLVENLARALVPLLQPDSTILPANRAIATEQLLRNPATLGEGLRRFAADLPNIATAPLIVVVDQFEEVYTLCREPAERSLFVDLLLHAATDASRHVSVVLTLRSDFLGETQRQHPELNRAIAANHELVPAMSKEELRQVIVEPARHAGRALDAATVDLLLSQAASSDSVLPLLEFALTRIWEGLTAGREPIATLENIGGVGGALAQRARAVFTSLSPTEQQMARRALVRLVQLGHGTRDTRRRAPIRELCGRSESEDEVLAVLRRFSAEHSRMITLFGIGAETVAEVTHEALFEHWAELRQWIDDSRADRRLHDRVVEAASLWAESGQQAGRLWRSPDLDLLGDYQRRRPEELGPQLEAFLLASQQAQDAEVRAREETALRVRQAEEQANWERQEKLLRERQNQARLSRILLGSALAIALVLAMGLGYGLYQQRLRTSSQVAAKESLRQQLLSNYVDRGWELLVEKQRPALAGVYLNEAYQNGAKGHPMLPYLLAEAMRPIEATQFVLRHGGRMVQLARFSPDNHRVLTASGDTAFLWDAETGRQLFNLMAGCGHIHSAEFSPDGRQVLIAGFDGAFVWDAQSGTLRFELKGHVQKIGDAGFSPDGRLILTAGKDHTARLWDAMTGAPVRLLQGHTGPIGRAIFSPSNSRVATSSSDGTVRIWDVESGHELHAFRFAEHSASLGLAGFIAFSPDGKALAADIERGGVRVWATETGEVKAELPGSRGVIDLRFSRDGQVVMALERNFYGRPVYGGESFGGIHPGSSVLAWHMMSASVLRTLRPPNGNFVAMAASPDGLHLALAADNNTASIWAADGTVPLTTLDGHTDQIVSIAYSPDGRRIVTASKDGTARIWSTGSNAPVAVQSYDRDSSIWFGVLSPDGRWLAMAWDDNKIRLADAQTGRTLTELTGHNDKIPMLAFSPDSKRLLSGSEDQTLQMWDVATGKSLWRLPLSGKPGGVGFSSDGRKLLIAVDSPEHAVLVLDAGSAHQLAKIAVGDYYRGAVFGVSEDQILTVIAGRGIQTWSAKDGKLLSQIPVTWGNVIFPDPVEFNSDRSLLATTDGNNRATIWDVATGRRLVELEGHLAPIVSVHFSQDGFRIATTSFDKTVRVWETRTGKLLATRGCITVLPAQFSPDGRSLITLERHAFKRWEIGPEERDRRILKEIMDCDVPFHLRDGVLETVRAELQNCKGGSAGTNGRQTSVE